MFLVLCHGICRGFVGIHKSRNVERAACSRSVFFKSGSLSFFEEEEKNVRRRWVVDELRPQKIIFLLAQSYQIVISVASTRASAKPPTFGDEISIRIGISTWSGSEQSGRESRTNLSQADVISVNGAWKRIIVRSSCLCDSLISSNLSKKFHHYVIAMIFWLI